MTGSSGRQVSETFKRNIFSQTSSDPFVILLTISSPDFTDDIRISSEAKERLPVSGRLGFLSRSMEFIFFPFSVRLPTDDATNTAKAEISIDNVNQEIIAQVRKATSALDIKLEVLLASRPDNPEMSISEFKLEKVNYDAFTITGEISVEYFDNEPFPTGRFVPSNWRGLF